MQADIRKLGGMSIYYPFLDSKSGDLRSLRSELNWILIYSLFGDRLLFPPRSLLSGQFALQNLSDLQHVPLLRSLVDVGALITTTTNSSIRDAIDLFENYSGFVARGPSRIADFAIYSRDEEFQKSLAAQYVSTRFHLLTDMPTLEQSAIISIANERQDHPQMVARIFAALEGSTVTTRQEVRSILTAGYFFAGARGNAAITPPVLVEQPHEHFEFLYSKPILRYFAFELQKRFKKPLSSLSPAQLQLARANLAVFREQYLLVAQKHRGIYQPLSELLLKSHPTWRTRAPILGLQALAATSVSLVLAPIFGMAAVPLLVGGKYAWEIVSKGVKVNDRASDFMRNQLVRAGWMEPYTKDVLEVLDSFDKGVKTIFRSRLNA